MPRQHSNVKEFEETVDRVFDRCRTILEKESNSGVILIAEQIFAGCRDLLIKKGAEYAGNFDRYANFKRHGAALGRTPFEVWAIYFNKHVDSINSAIKANPAMPQVISEPLLSRIQDCINYLLLDLGMTLEFARRTLVSEEGLATVDMLEAHVTEMVVLLVRLQVMVEQGEVAGAGGIA